MKKKLLPILFCLIITLSSYQLFAASEDGYGALGVGSGDYYYCRFSESADSNHVKTGHNKIDN